MQGSLNSQPNKFVFKGAVSVQADAAIRWRIFVDRKVVTPLRKLPACRRRGDDSDTTVIGIVRLMHMTENRKPYFPRCGRAGDKLVAVVETNTVQPLASHIDWRVM